MNIALCAPNKDVYSETFIHAHKLNLRGKVFYYYGSLQQIALEGKGRLDNSANWNLLLKRKLLRKPLSWYQQELLKKSFLKNDIDVVLAEYGPKAQSLLPVVKDLKIPLVVHFHGFDASVKDVILGNNNYQEVFQTAKYVVVVSKKMYSDLLALGCPEEKLVYNVYGPDEKFFEVQPKFKNLQFISIGRFVTKKAPYYLILAFRNVVKKFPRAELIMAGDGELLEVCRNLVAYYNLNNNIKFAGVITPEEYRNYLGNSMAMVQHSVTALSGDSEGTPVGILEASAAGLPVISTRHAGIPDVIIHEETGYLVGEHEVDKMSLYMIKVLENPQLAREIGNRGKKNIQKYYTLQRHIEELDKILKKALA